MPSWLDEPEAAEYFGSEDGSDGYFGEYPEELSLNGDDDDVDPEAVRRHRSSERRRRARGTSPEVRSRRGRQVSGEIVRTRPDVRQVARASVARDNIVASAIERQDYRLRGVENVALASLLVDPVQRLVDGTIPDFGGKPYIKAFIAVSPSLLLRRPKQGEGVSGALADPRLWLFAAVGALAFFENKGSVTPVTPVPGPPGPGSHA
jgi:hypothetical protein